MKQHALIMLCLFASGHLDAQPTPAELLERSSALGQYSVDVLRLSQQFLERSDSDLAFLASSVSNLAGRRGDSLFYLAVLVDVVPNVKSGERATTASAVNALIQREIGAIDSSIAQLELYLGGTENAALVLEARDLWDELRDVKELLSDGPVQ